MAAIDNPDLNGWWGGYGELLEIRGASYATPDVGDRDGITMQIYQAGGMAWLRIRQGHFGRICGSSVMSSSSPCSGIGVCFDTSEIMLDASCGSAALEQRALTEIWRKQPVDPYMLDPGPIRTFHMGSDAIHLELWTHACTSTGDRYTIDLRHKRHWALWMDSAGTLEIRYVLQTKPGFGEFSWFVAGSLRRC